MFKEIISFENLLIGYREARRSKRYQNYTLRFSRRLEDELLRLREELRGQTYEPSGYREFVIYEPKRREIKAPAFRDRVVHHALYRIIEPIFDDGFIYNSYSCRKNKGTHRAVKKLRKFLWSIRTKERQKKNGSRPMIYCLKCDVSKFFASVDHKILFQLILKKIKDSKTTWLINKIIRSGGDKAGKGIPIGNLTSQLFANVYLNELDQFTKHKLREKYYLRYMDDFLVLGTDKAELRRVRDKIRDFLKSELDLSFNPKKVRLSPINKGIDFLGYVVFLNFVLLRSSTVKRWKKKIKNVEDDNMESLLTSWYGYTKHADAYRIYSKYSLFSGHSEKYLGDSPPKSDAGSPHLERSPRRKIEFVKKSTRKIN